MVIYMMKRYIFLVILCFSLTANAAEFTASVSEREVAYNDTFQLSLKFTGMKVKGGPDVKALEGDFEIAGVSNLSSTSIINGDVTTSREWIYTLKPKKKGEITIPSISIESEGKKLKSQPVKVKVVSARVLPQKDSSSGIFLESSTTKQELYQCEPTILSLKLYTLTETSNITVSKIELPETIVQQIGTYNIYKATRGNLTYDVVEWKFNITPTKPGRVKIPGFEVRGMYSSRDNPVRTHIFDDPFISSISRGMMPGEMKAFRLAFNEVVLNVKEAHDLPKEFQDAQWLPAKSVSLSENWSSDEFVEGQPVKRSVVMNATGVLDSQLPKIVMSGSKDYKSYADPEVKTVKFDNDIIRSSRTEYFTVIPTNAGKIEFPEIVVPYWNIDKDRLEEARLPAKIVTVKVAAAGKVVDAEKVDAEKVGEAKEGDYTASSEIVSKSQLGADSGAGDETAEDTQEDASKSNTWLYLFIGFAGLATGLVVYAFLRRVPAAVDLSSREPNRDEYLAQGIEANAGTEDGLDKSVLGTEVTKLAERNSYKKALLSESKIQKKIRLNIGAINKISNIPDLHKFLQDYACSNWNMHANTSLEIIFINLESRYPGLFAKNKEVKDVYKEITNKLYKHLYYEISREVGSDKSRASDADKDIKIIKEEVKKLINLIDEAVAASGFEKKTVELPKLNPY